MLYFTKNEKSILDGERPKKYIIQPKTYKDYLKEAAQKDKFYKKELQIYERKRERTTNY